MLSDGSTRARRIARMSPGASRFVVGLILGLVVGGAVGYGLAGRGVSPSPVDAQAQGRGEGLGAATTTPARVESIPRAGEGAPETFDPSAPRVADPGPARARIGIEGRVIAPEDETETEFRVYLAPIDAGETLDGAALKTRSVRRARGERYELLGLEPGRYFLGATREDDGALAASATVEVRDHVAHQDLEAAPLDPASLLSVRAFSPKGEPVDDFEVEVAVLRGPSSRHGYCPTISRKEGEVRARIPAELADAFAGKLGAGARLEVGAVSPDFGRRRVGVQPGVRAVSIRFETPASLDLLVTDLPATGLAGAPEAHLRSRSFGAGARKAIGPKGAVTLGPLEPGEYELVVTAAVPEPDGRTETISLHRSWIALAAGENSVSVRARPLARIAVTVPGAQEGDRVSLRELDAPFGGLRHRVLGASETLAVFEAVPHGAYGLGLQGATRTRALMPLAVAGNADVTFEAIPVDALRVSRVDPQGALARAGFREGDLVVAIDGAPFASEAEVVARLGAIGDGAQVVYTVARGAAREDITLDASVLRRSAFEDLGGSFEASSQRN